MADIIKYAVFLAVMTVFENYAYSHDSCNDYNSICHYAIYGKFDKSSSINATHMTPETRALLAKPGPELLEYCKHYVLNSIHRIPKPPSTTPPPPKKLHASEVLEFLKLKKYCGPINIALTAIPCSKVCTKRVGHKGRKTN